MTSAFSWQNSYYPLLCCILYSNAKFACYSKCFLTSYFCIPVPCNEKDIFWVLVLEGHVGLHDKLYDKLWLSVVSESLQPHGL